MIYYIILYHIIYINIDILFIYNVYILSQFIAGWHYVQM